MESPYLEMKHITKLFSKVVANNDVSLHLGKGEVLALLGENGAGKSTIMKVLYGLYHADSGSIRINGEEKKIRSPKDAMALGISMIQQHFSLVPANTVTENIIMGNAHGIIDWKKKEQEIQALAEQYQFDIDAKAYVRDLSVGAQQKVEILKALYQQAKILIMDEPTAVLTPQEIDSLMDFVKSFAAAGNSVVFITHKLREVMEVADRIIVMRNGVLMGSLEKDKTDEKELSRLMVGRELVKTKRDEEQQEKEQADCLVLKNITLKAENEIAKLEDVSFSIKEGEIFGLAGVSENGQQELCEVLSGYKSPTSGTIWFQGEDITQSTIEERISMGIGYVPADRHKFGMVMDMSLSENMLLKSSFKPDWYQHYFIDKKKLNAYTASMIERFDVKASGPDDLARSLSGGNQQKVVVAREVDNGETLIIFDQPTRGLDLGAIQNVHETMFGEKRKGKSVLLISTELSEIFDLCDRIAVIYKGRIQGIYQHTELTTEKIGLLMAGYQEKKEALV